MPTGVSTATPPGVSGAKSTADSTATPTGVSTATPPGVSGAKSTADSTATPTGVSTATPPGVSGAKSTADSTATPTGVSTATPPGVSGAKSTADSTATPTGVSTATPPGVSGAKSTADSTATPTGVSTATPPGVSGAKSTGDSTTTPTGVSTATPPGVSGAKSTADSTTTPTGVSTATPPGVSGAKSTADSTATPTGVSTATPPGVSSVKPAVVSAAKPTESENQRGILEKETKKFKAAIVQLEKDVDEAKCQAENYRNICRTLQRERKILNKYILKAKEEAHEQQTLQDQARKTLENEIENLKSEIVKQRKTTSNLEKERDRYVLENKELSNKLGETSHKVKLKEEAIFDYEKKLIEAEKKFRLQQNSFEAVDRGRRAFSKQLIEAENEILEFKKKMKIMNQAEKQNKEVIAMKETQLMRDKIALQRSEKEKTLVKLELKKIKAEFKEIKEDNAVHNVKEIKLQKTIQDADEERQKLKKEMEQIMNEKNMLGTQLMRRNEELSLLNEKLRILESTLQKGEAQYQQRVEDVRLLKVEVKKLRQEKNIQSRSIVNMTDMRQEILHLQRDVTREKSKARALEEELQNPPNLHRWRILEGSDPTTYELIQKNQLLQKRLQALSQTVSEREGQLQESQKMCKKLQDLLSRQPGPDVAIRLQQTQHALQDKDKKIKCLTSELNMYKAQASEYKSELEEVNEELKLVKNKYFVQKRREQKVKEREHKLILPPINPRGGFNF
ncbi:cilia- and flagella-associated protein 58-like [Periplaneta americana]|uniref:cilia- and flagella-associated protein 58-like n=1 Tax=Periplaneta americana TaxID=6978 RepID=UPI0037E8E0C1